jgi:hypothetical protein
VQKFDWYSSGPAKGQWYVRNAQGNVMAVYSMTLNADNTWSPMVLTEHHIYGSSRLGVINAVWT